MRAFLDTNVLIDILVRREGFYEAASNKKHFPENGIQILTPVEFLSQL